MISQQWIKNVYGMNDHRNRYSDDSIVSIFSNVYKHESIIRILKCAVEYFL